jgi:hypothetical protein
MGNGPTRWDSNPRFCGMGISGTEGKAGTHMTGAPVAGREKNIPIPSICPNLCVTSAARRTAWCARAVPMPAPTTTCHPPSEYILWSHVLPTSTLPVASSAARGETALFFAPFGRMP